MKIVPEGEARGALEKDYAAMLGDAIMVGDALPFDRLMDTCTRLEAELNKGAIQ